MKTRNATMLPLVMGLFCSATVNAQTESQMMQKSESGQPLSEPIQADLCTPDGIAIGGIDLVSYRQDGGPVKGLSEFSTEHGDLTYLFATAENRRQFLQNTEWYLPEYAGFCAITLALGRVTCPEFHNFKIENDRLLLFETTGFTNGKILWNSDPGTFRQQADANYSIIKD